MGSQQGGASTTPDIRRYLTYNPSTLISLIRPEAPDFIDTSALRHLKCFAIKVISSAFALPPVGGVFNCARHEPSVSCASKELWELGFTLTRRITATSQRRASVNSSGARPRRPNRS